MVRVSDKIISTLIDNGISDIFTVAGGGAISLNDAIAKSRGMNYYSFHHEQAVAMASEAYARVKRDIGVSLVTTGPGGTNAITGVVGSWIDSIPHLVISGQVYLSQTIQSTGLRQLGSQEINIIDIVKPITKYAVLVKKKSEVIYQIEKAIFIAKQGRPGPVWVDVPMDIQNGKLEANQFKKFKSEKSPLIKFSGDLDGEIAEIIDLLKNSNRPLVHIGQGVEIANGLDNLMEFVEKNNIPFVTARNANKLVDWSHGLYVGRPGTFAQRAANFAVQNSDLYIAIGTRLSLPQTGYNSKDYARNAIKVMVDIDKSELDKPTLDLDIKVHNDAKTFLTIINKKISSSNFDFSDWAKVCNEWKIKYPVVLTEYKHQKEFVNSYYFTEVLSKLLNEEDVIVTDMGLAYQGTHQAFKVKKGQEFFSSCGLSSMGAGLPGAIGACIATNMRRTICIAGDGGLQMTIQELATVKHYNLPIKLFIYNNYGYSTIKQSQEIGFNGRLMGCDQDHGLSFPDFQKVSTAYGIESVRISTHKDLIKKVKNVLSPMKPIICELMINPDQIQAPRAIPKYKEDGTSEQTPIEDLYPFIGKGELRKNMIAEK